jgi:hypothetical protein
MLDEILDVQAISKFGCDKNLFSQTYDGASNTEGHVTGVQTKISYIISKCTVHTLLCSFHKFSSAAQVSNNQGQQIFFQNLRAL